MFKKKLKLLVQGNQELGEESFQILSDQHAFALSGGGDCPHFNSELCHTYNPGGSCGRFDPDVCQRYNKGIQYD